MTKVLATIATTVGGAVVLAFVWWMWSLTADPLVRKSTVESYQLKADADARFEQMAADNDTDRLNTQLALLKIRLERFVETANVRPLTEAEQIELRSIEREIAVILERLSAKG